MRWCDRVFALRASILFSYMTSTLSSWNTRAYTSLPDLNVVRIRVVMISVAHFECGAHRVAEECERESARAHALLSGQRCRHPQPFALLRGPPAPHLPIRSLFVNSVFHSVVKKPLGSRLANHLYIRVYSILFSSSASIYGDTHVRVPFSDPPSHLRPTSHVFS